MLTECLKGTDCMTDWEVEFLESIGHRADNPMWVPSDKQFDRLKAIWEDMP
jgi:hypothetical protein